MKTDQPRKGFWSVLSWRKRAPNKAVSEKVYIPVELEKIMEHLGDIIKKCPAQVSTVMESSEQEVCDEPPIVEPVVFGRAPVIEVIKRYLLEKNAPDAKVPKVICIVGKAGIGKTAVAELLFKHPEVNDQIKPTMWVKGSETSQFNDILKFIESNRQRKLLVVLDDVSVEDSEKWKIMTQKVMDSKEEIRILVTTCEVAVYNTIHSSHTYRLKELQPVYCWQLFKHVMISLKLNWERKSEEIGKLVQICNGLPSAVVALGRSIKKNSSTMNLGDLKDAEKILAQYLQDCYNDLPSAIQQCLLHCTMFGKGMEIKKNDLIQLWMAQGYLTDSEEMETTGDEYFQRLLACSFFKDVQRDSFTDDVLSCKLHSMVYDIAMMEYLRMDADAPENADGAEVSKRRHVTVFRKQHMENQGEPKKSASILSSIEKLNKLRTLYISIQDGMFMPENASTLWTRLRALKVQTQMPQELEKMKHLRYLDLSCNPELKDISESLCNLQNLQTLNLRGCKGLTKLPPDMKMFQKLRSIDLSENDFIKELPESLWDLSELRALTVSKCRDLIHLHDDIDKLNKLRYLDLSENHSLQKLPANLSKLSNLKTLKLRFCSCLTSLPDDIGLLKSLTLLDLYGANLLKHLPKCFTGLSYLQVLTRFPVSEDPEACNLEDLSKLQRLQGNLLIDGLDGINDVLKIPKTTVRNKNLQRLELSMGGPDDENVIDALEPNPELEILHISHYRGILDLPTSITKHSALQELVLTDFSRCERLPPLGGLPFLQILEIRGIEKVKRVDNLGSDCTGGKCMIAFPRLNKLLISWMPNLEMLLGEDDNEVSIMPCLSYLGVYWCQKLKIVPKFLDKAPLDDLIIEHCPDLEKGFNTQERKKWPIVPRNPNCRINIGQKLISQPEWTPKKLRK